jgi:hypothetical protein
MRQQMRRYCRGSTLRFESQYAEHAFVSKDGFTDEDVRGAEGQLDRVKAVRMLLREGDRSPGGTSR